ncbi:hypothetical protein LAZ67_8001714 [Cordylochernes scorpioides]|uniref:Mos1 transposase HTH domain-containing protein n=1 Tax=Cordylochernes scorpioides TaxID=51811 RepID=A0ABY6KVI0_9ARAC|nr:hypothetical protein LAZ67_8001714 [Cordylochernes scorpioides]
MSRPSSTLSRCPRDDQGPRCEVENPGKTPNDIEPNVNTRIRQRSVTEFLFKSGDISATTIHSKLQPVYGNETLDRSIIQRWVQRFQKGDFDLHDKERPGSLLELLSDLGYRKLCSKWVPKFLTREMMQTRREICLDLIKSYPGPASEAFKGVITCEETWVYHYDPFSKRQSIAISTKRPGLKDCQIKFHQDNARPHTAQQTLAQISRYGWTLMPHPAYSPDLAPSDFYLFGKLGCLGDVYLDARCFVDQLKELTGLTVAEMVHRAQDRDGWCRVWDLFILFRLRTLCPPSGHLYYKGAESQPELGYSSLNRWMVVASTLGGCAEKLGKNDPMSRSRREKLEEILPVFGPYDRRWGVGIV